MKTRIIGYLVLAAGLFMMLAGILSWVMTSSQLASERITVAGDAPSFANAEVRGPLTAYAQSEAVKKHIMDASGGRTYAELGADVRQAEAAGDTAKAEELQKVRTMVETGNFVRASLLTSVLAFGLSALVAGLGLLFGLIGWALSRVKEPVAEVVRVEENAA